MANLVDSEENKILDGLLGVTPYTTVTTVYLALFTAAPTDTGSVTAEVAGGSYNRVSLAGLFSAATGTIGESKNTSAIIFPVSTADWGTITHIGIMASGVPTTADMIMWGALVTPVPMVSSDIFDFSVGDLVVTID